jgi:hypothetical protein
MTINRVWYSNWKKEILRPRRQVGHMIRHIGPPKLPPEPDVNAIAQKAAQLASQQTAKEIIGSIEKIIKKQGIPQQIDISQIVEVVKQHLPKPELSKIKEEEQQVFVKIDENKELESNIKDGLGNVTIKKDTKAKSTIKELKRLSNGNNK